MPEFYSQAAYDAGKGLDEFTAAYIIAMYWTDSCHDFKPDDEEGCAGFDRDGNSFDSEDELDIQTLVRIIDECKDFQESNKAHLEAAYNSERVDYGPGNAGHDFWLTRNGHGAGFWDRGLGQVGKELTDFSKPYGEVYVYRGDDGKVYIG